MSRFVAGVDSGAIFLDLVGTGSYWSTSGFTAVFVIPVSFPSSPELPDLFGGCSFRYFVIDLANSVVLKRWMASLGD